jgi:hypothetical protein
MHVTEDFKKAGFQRLRNPLLLICQARIHHRVTNIPAFDKVVLNQVGGRRHVTGR